MDDDQTHEFTFHTRDLLPLYTVTSNLEDSELTNRVLVVKYKRHNDVEQFDARMKSSDKSRKKIDAVDTDSGNRIAEIPSTSATSESGKAANHLARFAQKKLTSDGTTSRRKNSSKSNSTREGVFESMRNLQELHKQDLPKRRYTSCEETMRKGFDSINDENLDQDNLESVKVHLSDNPEYEDPRDVIGEKASKFRRRKSNQSFSSSPRVITTKEKEKIGLKEQKKKLAKKYEHLLISLMDKCEENMLTMEDRQNQIDRLKEKLKTVVAFNKQFAEENGRLKRQYNNMIEYIEDCKKLIADLEAKNLELEDNLKQFQLPSKDTANPELVPLVEVCMSCNTREIEVRKVREMNSRLQLDLEAMKDVIYRLNMQLSRYQEKTKCLQEDIEIPVLLKKRDSIDKAEGNVQELLSADKISELRKDGRDKSTMTQRDELELSGLLSAQALGPLFESYQNSILEKDNLIVDYEKQFDSFNQKMKNIVNENKNLAEKLSTVEEEIMVSRQKYKKVCVEKETMEIEKSTLLERTEMAENKLKEVYELYEDKVAAMMRDYETVHREYYAMKTALAASESKIISLEANFRSPSNRTVPADVHERRIEDCKRLFDELKHQYNMETEKRNAQVEKLLQDKEQLEKQLSHSSSECETLKTDLKEALKNVRLYKKAATIFRSRFKASVASMNSLRKVRRKPRIIQVPVPSAESEKLKETIYKVNKIKEKIQSVKASAYQELEELERRLHMQERNMAQASADHSRDMERMRILLEHKERIIRSLIDKVSDVEEVRLSQSINQTECFKTPEQPVVAAKDTETPSRSTKFVPRPDGYFLDQKSTAS